MRSATKAKTVEIWKMLLFFFLTTIQTLKSKIDWTELFTTAVDWLTSQKKLTFENFPKNHFCGAWALGEASLSQQPPLPPFSLLPEEIFEPLPLLPPPVSKGYIYDSLTLTYKTYPLIVSPKTSSYP